MQVGLCTVTRSTISSLLLRLESLSCCLHFQDPMIKLCQRLSYSTERPCHHPDQHLPYCVYKRQSSSLPFTSILTTCIAPNHLGCTRRQTRPTGTGPFGDVPSDGTTLHVHKMSKMLTDLPFGSSQVVHPLTRWNVLVAPYIGRRTSLVTHSVGFGWTRKPGPPRGTPAKSPSHHNSQTLLRPERHESGAQSRPVVSNFDPRHVKGGIGRPHLCQRLTTRGWGAFYGALPDRSRVCNLKGRLITLWEACRGSSLFL